MSKNLMLTDKLAQQRETIEMGELSIPENELHSRVYN